MARKKGSDSQETYARIVRAARTLLQQGGPKAVSFRRVAKESQLSTGSVSYYFPERHAMLQACLDPHLQRRRSLMRDLLERLERDGPIAEALADVADSAVSVAFVQRDFVRLRAMTHAELRIDPLSVPKDADTRLPFLERLSELLGARLNLPVRNVRLSFQTINYALARYGELSDTELCSVCDCATPEQAREHIRAHIQHCTSSLMTLSPEF